VSFGASDTDAGRSPSGPGRTRGRAVLKVVFDSSFLMAVADEPTTWFEDMVDLVGRFQPVLLSCVREELEKLASGEGRRSRSARVALEMASGFAGGRCGGAGVDDEVVSFALTEGAAVATTDAGLLESLRGARVKAVTLRGGRVSLG
jgi:rRNA-processing protein FCF1